MLTWWFLDKRDFMRIWSYEKGSSSKKLNIVKIVTNKNEKVIIFKNINS